MYTAVITVAVATTTTTIGTGDPSQLAPPLALATTAAVAAATAPRSSTVVVAAPAVGTVVSALPGSCGAISTGNAVVYNCNNVYYSPFYQGTTVVYQVVTYP
jgi:hypothetical protein